MKVKIVFEPDSERDRAALSLLNIHNRLGDGFIVVGEPERQQRVLGALINILNMSIIP